MKNLKYLQIYEKFDSLKLGKVLSFVGKDSRSKFLTLLKNICKGIDFPISSLSDDMFEYLPFKAALNLREIKKDDDKSKCHKCGGSGLLDKPWGNKYGKGITKVDCPSCSGSGFSETPKKEGDIQYIKFWFNSEGKYVTTTMVDGIIRKNFPADLYGEYMADKKISYSDIYNLPTGSIIYSSLGGSRPMKWTLYNTGRYIYAIQNSRSGTPPNGNDWKKFGSLSWNISYREEINGDIILLKKKEKDTVVEENPYTWNVVSTFDSNGRLNHVSYDSEHSLREANFALVLDYKKLKHEEFTTVSATKTKRSEFKKGALSLMKNDEIKNANIERYLTKLASDINIDKDFSGSIKMMSRIYGGPFSLFIIYGGWKFDDMYYLLTDIGIVMDENSKDSDKKYYLAEISKRLKGLYKFSMAMNSSLLQSFTAMRKMASKEEGSEEVIKIINKIDEVSRKIGSKILESPCESMFDLESLKFKIRSLRSFCREGRFNLEKISYTLEYLHRHKEDCFYNLRDLSNVNRHRIEIMKNLDYVAKYVEKL